MNIAINNYCTSEACYAGAQEQFHEMCLNLAQMFTWTEGWSLLNLVLKVTDALTKNTVKAIYRSKFYQPFIYLFIILRYIDVQHRSKSTSAFKLKGNILTYT